MSSDARTLPNSPDEGFVFIANDILRKCKINGEFIESLTQCSDSFFVAVYEGILGEPLRGIIPEAVSREDKVHNCITVIDALSCDVLNVDLSHISAEDIVDGDISSIQNLLEIFKELLDFILDVDEGQELHANEDEQNDSNLLSSDHEVISDILNQELTRSSSYDQSGQNNDDGHGDDNGDQSLKNEGRLVDTPPSHFPIIDVDISMIPKWSKSAGSSRSSACESNSTDDIIRESELIERQLASEYPSLHKSREMKEQRAIEEEARPSTSKGRGKTAREKTQSKGTNSRETLKSDLKIAGRVGPEKEHFSFDRVNTDRGLVTDQLETGLSGTGDTMGSREVPTRDTIGSRDVSTRDTIGSQEASTRDTMGSREVSSRDTIGSREVSDRDTMGFREVSTKGTIGLRGVPNDLKTASHAERLYYKGDYGDEQHAVRDTRGTERDSKERQGAVRDTKGKQPKSRDKGTVAQAQRLQQREPEKEQRDVLRGMSDSKTLNPERSETDYTIGPRDKHGDFRYTTGSQLGVRDTRAHEKNVPEIREERTTTRNVDRQRGGTGATSSGTAGTHEKSSTVRDKRGSMQYPVTRGVELSSEEESNVKKLQSEVGETSRSKETEANKFGPYEYLGQRSDVRTHGVPYKPNKEQRAHEVPKKLPDHGEGPSRLYRELREDRRTVVRRQVPEGIKDRVGFHVDVTKLATETQKSSVHRGATGERRENAGQTGSRQDDRRVNDERGILDKDKQGDIGDSDTSGALWDDQISPLDASELAMGTKMTFDKIGMNRESGEQRLGRVEKDRAKREHDSSVFRHYHHHFHHPHGSSEDLIEDIEYATRQERRETDAARSTTKSRGNAVQDKPVLDRVGKSSLRPEGKRSVKFKDDVDTFLITNRLDRLKRDLERDAREQEDRRLLMKSGYGGHLDYLNDERKRIEKEINQVNKTTVKPRPRRLKRGAGRVSRKATTTQTIYGKTTPGRKARFPSSKARKRSTSSSPKIQQRKKTAKQLEKGDVLLPTMLDEFPFLHLSPHTMQTMRRKQTEQLATLSKSATQQGQTKTQKVIEDAERRQQTLLKILRKDLLHNQRMREQKERNEQERAIKSKLREKRQASARARRYYEDYQLRMRARLLKRRTREEQIFKNLFQDGLAIQKQRVNELRTYAKEQRELRAEKEQNELQSLENYYRDQYSILAETISREKEALQIREKAQEKVIHQMQRNLREKLQKEVTDIQETLVRDEDDAYFRRLDAERLRKQMQMTAFQNFS